MLTLLVIASLILLALVLTPGAWLYASVKKKHEYDFFQQHMQKGDKCLWKFNKKYIEVKIVEVYKENVLFEDKHGVLHVSGKNDLFPIDF